MSMKKNGQVVDIDWYNKQLSRGATATGDIPSREVVIEEIREAGYNLTIDKEFLQYYLEFEL